MANCPKCDSIQIGLFSDTHEAFWLHAVPFSSFKNSIKAAWEGLSQAPLRKCGQCGIYCFICPACEQAVGVSRRLSDGSVVPCSHCHAETMLRNPNHFFGAPP